MIEVEGKNWPSPRLNYPEFLVANLIYAGGHAWPPDLNFGRQKRNLVDKIEP
jgi:hypothetical protein